MCKPIVPTATDKIHLKEGYVSGPLDMRFRRQLLSRSHTPRKAVIGKEEE